MPKIKEPKKFSLKKIENNMLAMMQQRHQQELGNFLSFIALERLAYEVTDKTKFSLEDGVLTIEEVEDKKEEVATA